jgi:Actinobacteria/chloroflexi VLRF1 release factor
MKNPAAGGGRWVSVTPGRFPTWVDEFARRHGGPLDVTQGSAAQGSAITFRAADGAVAECHAPFPPLPRLPADAPADSAASAAAAAVAAHALADRVVGVLLVRLGGYAVGVFAGSPPVLVAAKTGSRLVHGRSAAGGWSQHRFARRREKQASEALAAAASAAAAIFGQHASQCASQHASQCAGLDAVVLGGDRRTVAGLADDPRLAPYLALAADRFLTVPDPRLAVLREAPKDFLAVKIRLAEPVPDTV